MMYISSSSSIVTIYKHPYIYIIYTCTCIYTGSVEVDINEIDSNDKIETSYTVHVN